MNRKVCCPENRGRSKSPSRSKANTKSGSSDSQSQAARMVGKLESQLLKVKNGKCYRVMLAEIETKSFNTLETINLCYKDKNIVKSCKKRDSHKVFGFKRPLTVDLKKGVFSLKQSILRAKTPSNKAILTQKCNWRTEVKSPSKGSAFVFVPVLHNTLTTMQDSENYENLTQSYNKPTPWKQLMRDFDMERKKACD